MLTVDANNPPIGWNGINVIAMDQLAMRCCNLTAATIRFHRMWSLRLAPRE